MTQKTTTQPTAVELLREAQDYRTSLESLMSIGRSMMGHPSLEDDAVTAFQVLAENVLEEANHQGDLAVVEGVDEPQARVELIMQDVLTPRLTEVETIEQALMDKAEAAEPVPFTTRDAETSVSQEALYTAEVLDLFRENIQTVRQVLSLESMNTDLARPMVMQVAKRVEDSLGGLGISMEALEQTQVLGDMSEAVERIEALVTKAHEEVLEQAEGVRNEAQSLGSDGEDRMGDLIEKHRADNPSGVVLDDDTNVTTIEHEVDKTEPAESAEVIETPEGEGDLGAADAELDDGAVSDDADASAVEAVNAEAELADATAEVEAGEVEETETESETETEEETSEEEDKDDEEEEEGDETASTESRETVVFESMAARSENVDAAKDILNALMSFLDSHDLLTEAGHDALMNGIGDEFVFDESMVSERTAEVLARHYQTWMAGSVRDGEANTRAMGVLLGL